MDLQLHGQRVLVTGSTQGIGFAIAEALLNEGARVVINGRSQGSVDSALERLKPLGRAEGIAADVSTEGGVAAVLTAAGDVDVLISNAGVFELADFETTTDDEWQKYLDLHLMAAVRLSRALLPGMLERGQGRVVFVGTESAVDVPGDMIHYGVSKAAALALSNGLAKLTKGTGVTVNTVLGGPTYSDGVRETVESIAGAQRLAPEQLQQALVRDTSLIQRFIRPDEVAAMVAYLASPLASATNGAAIRVDGGVLPTVL